MAVTLVFNPFGLYGIDIILEGFGVLAAVLISIIGYKAYRLTKQKRFFYFSLAFMLITLSFIARAITAAVVLGQVGAVSGASATATFSFLEQVFDWGRFVYFGFVLAAYLILLALSMRIYDRKLIVLLSIFMGLFAFSAFDSLPLLFYLVSFVLLAFIAWNYRANYHEKKTKAAFLASFAFCILTLEPLFFMASFLVKELAIGAYIVRLVAYVSLLLMLVKVYSKK
ncbi:hypothetical protein HY492_00865 [Candidatus Woesearchaeota archaeon]|nr:hypothetical protein [Candidatus Woesearchaeota archaeon]